MAVDTEEMPADAIFEYAEGKLCITTGGTTYECEPLKLFGYVHRIKREIDSLRAQLAEAKPRSEAVKAFAMVDPNGMLRLFTIAETEEISKFRMANSFREPWRYWQDRGYRCAQVEVKVIDQEAGVEP